jgi:protoporphyrinogen oxidase
LEKHSTVILGAGLTGLSCALHLGRDYLLVEKEREPGGIVRTRITDTAHGPFYCDGTGHWLHLRDADMRALVERALPGGLVEYERKAVIHLHGVFTPYPFQANTHGLPRDIVLDCLLGLLKARHPEDFKLPPPGGCPANFRESLERLFGEGICRHFMVPYNEKLLGVRLEEIAAEYADRFIPQPSLEDVVRGALGFSREALGYNAKFVYPHTGGISALPRALAAQLPVPPRYGVSATAVDLPVRTVAFSDGTTARYERLLNTMPLVHFLRLCGPLPAEVHAAARQLRATTVHYFDLGVRGPGAEASAHHWIYFPEPEFIFYRAGSYSAVHRTAAPEGCRSYYVEMSGGITELLARPEELRQRVLTDLRRAHVLAPEDEIIFMELRTIPHAYVIFDRHYEAARRTVLDFLATHGVLTHGRWGGWNYGGMEDALLEGRAAAAQFAT